MCGGGPGEERWITACGGGARSAGGGSNLAAETAERA